MREILGLGWAQQTPMAAPCPVVLTFGGAREALNWTEPAEVREILGLGWAQQTPMAAPCPVVPTPGGAPVALQLGQPALEVLATGKC